MNFNKGEVLTLENGNDYVILDSFMHDGQMYLYLSMLDLKHICFVSVSEIDENVDLNVVKDENLIKTLSQNYILKNTEEN